MRALLQLGARVNDRSALGLSPLEMALSAPRQDRHKKYGVPSSPPATVLALLLLQAGADTHNVRGAQGGASAIDLAGKAGDEVVFRALLAAGASPHPLPFIAWANHAAEVAGKRGKGNQDVGTNSDYLTIAAERGHTGVILAALEAGVDPNFRAFDRNKYTLLLTAVYFDDGKGMLPTALLAAGADVNVLCTARNQVGVYMSGVDSTSGLGVEFGAPGLSQIEKMPTTALDVALLRNHARKCNPVVVALLRARGAKTAEQLLAEGRVV